MTIESYQKLLQTGHYEIFVISRKPDGSCTARKVEQGIVPTYRSVCERGTLEQVRSECMKQHVEGRHPIFIEDQAKKKADLDMMARSFRLYRETKEAENYSGIAEYQACTGRWTTVCTFCNPVERMQYITQLQSDPHSLLLENWQPENLTPDERYTIIRRHMLEANAAGEFDQIFAPYFTWKLQDSGTPAFTHAEAWQMYDAATSRLNVLGDRHPGAASHIDFTPSDNPWQYTEAYGEDKYHAAYLQIITDELSELLASEILN